MSLKPPLPPNAILDYRNVYDEGSKLGIEDGINFTGSGVTVTEDVPNRRLNVSIPGGTIGDGGEPYTAVDSLSANPRAVTDWGAIINTALTNGTRRFLFGPYDYPFTTMIDGRQLQGIMFQGAGGWDWYDPGRTDGPGSETGHTRVIWNGTGSGYAIDFSSTATGVNGNTGPVLEDLMLMYSSASYTGKLVNYSNSTMAGIKRCWFGSVTSTRQTAAAALALDGVNTIDVEDSTFDNSFGAAVRGREAAGYSNVVRFRDCTFNGGVEAAIMNPGLDWLCDHCIFEFPSLALNKAMISTDFTYTGDQIDLTLRDCAYWDAAGGATQKMVYAPNGNQFTLSALNCKDHTNAGLARLYDMQGTGNIVISGGDTTNKIDVGDATVANTKKNMILIEALEITSTVDTGMILNANTGHTVVDISANSGGPNLVGNSGQVRTLAHERTHRIDQPAIVAHSGVTNHVFNVYGSDLAGFILIKNNGGGAGPTGLLADVTLAAPPASPGVGTGINTHNELPVVQVVPFQADDGGNNFVTPSMTVTYACQPYAHAKTIGASGSQAAFEIGVNVGIAAGATIGLAYRVIHI